MQTTSTHTLKATYDSLSRFASITNTLTGDQTYQYDALSQLTQENDRPYAFDSIGNPIGEEIQIGPCNELLQTENCSIQYDLNGNPTRKIDQNGHLTDYRFDALDRLVEITTLSRSIRYFYDELNRLCKKEVLENGKSQAFYFLYDADAEIGMLDSQNRILQLKILGLGLQGDISAAVAIEFLMTY